MPRVPLEFGEELMRKQMNRPQHKFKILALDGGGIRGVFAAKYLAELQNNIAYPLHQYFDLITGTSTGGLIAIALALGMSPSEILDIYKTKGKRIFRKRPRLVRFLNAVTGPLYEIESFKKVLYETFGDKKIGDSLTRLCIPSVDSATGKIKVYKTDHHPSLFKDYELFARDVAQGTAAAPFYFSSALVNGANLLDGGLWANNPSLIGLCEAMTMFGKSPNDIAILSIGTGEEVVQWDNTKSVSLGILRFSGTKKLVKLVLSAQAQAVERIVEYIGPGVYKRINVVLPWTFPLDDISKIRALERLADQKAQETTLQVKEIFLKKTVRKFIPQHKQRGARKHEA